MTITRAASPSSIRSFYAKDIERASDQVLATFITGDTDSAIMRIVAEMASEEAARRGHELPYFWALSYRAFS